MILVPVSPTFFLLSKIAGRGMRGDKMQQGSGGRVCMCVRETDPDTKTVNVFCFC